MESNRDIMHEIFWQERYLPIFLGIALILAGIYVHIQIEDKVKSLNVDNYINISDYLSEDIIIADRPEFNPKYIGFKLASKKYDFIDFEIKYIFDELDISKMKDLMIQGNKITLWVKKDIYYQTLNLRKIQSPNNLQQQIFEVYMFSINNEPIFNFEDLKNRKKENNWLGMFIGLSGFIFLIPPLVIKNPNRISFYGRISFVVFVFIGLVIVLFKRLFI